MAEQPHDYFRAASKSAEKMMRQWAIGLEVKERVEHEQAVQELPQDVHSYVAVSRDTGACAGDVSRRVAEKLGWDVLNREVLNIMAEEYNLEKTMVEAVDETTTSWLLEVFGKWISQQVVTNTEYMTHLGRLLLMAARHRSTVFVGRGAQFFLPRERGLAVQIVAPMERRIQAVAEREQTSENAARRRLIKKDRERRDFIRQHFDRDVTDPHLYDLVINLEYLPVDWAVDLIVNTCKRRFDFD